MSCLGVVSFRILLSLPRPYQKISVKKKYPAQIKQFGEKIKELRAEYGLTQVELGKNSGVDTRTIQRIESGEFAVGLHIVFALAKAFKMKPYELLLHIDITEKKNK
jgi:DNA-binding XRE family transcriptional regulator